MVWFLEENMARFLEEKPGHVQQIPARQRPQTYIKIREALVATSTGQHSSDEVAEPEPRSQPHRASLGDLGAPSKWKKVYQPERAIPRSPRRMGPDSIGYTQRSCGVYAASNEGRYKVTWILD